LISFLRSFVSFFCFRKYLNALCCFFPKTFLNVLPQRPGYSRKVQGRWIVIFLCKISKNFLGGGWRKDLRVFKVEPGGYLLFSHVSLPLRLIEPEPLIDPSWIYMLRERNLIVDQLISFWLSDFVVKVSLDYML